MLGRGLCTTVLGHHLACHEFQSLTLLTCVLATSALISLILSAVVLMVVYEYE